MPNLGDQSGRWTWNGTRWSCAMPSAFPPAPPCPPGTGPFLSPPAAPPQTITGSGAVTSQSVIIAGTSTVTLTLPSPATSTGQWLYLKSITAQIVQSSIANVVPLSGGSPGTAIFSAFANVWVNMQSDGTNWIVFATGYLG
jgi:hypothetical protein